MKFKFIITFLTIFLFSIPISADELKLDDKETEFNVYTGMFDFSDDGKRATLIGFQHQNENLNRDTFLGNLSPITGAMITADNATYMYTGVQSQYKIGALNFNPATLLVGVNKYPEPSQLGHLVSFLYGVPSFFIFFIKPEP